MHFLQLIDRAIGWKSRYLINGVLFDGYMLKVPTPSSNVLVFFDPCLKLTKDLIHEEQDGTLTLKVSDDVKGSSAGSHDEWPKVFSLTNMIRGEVFDNYEESFQGLVCYVVSTESTVRVRMGNRLISTWYQIEKFI